MQTLKEVAIFLLAVLDSWAGYTGGAFMALLAYLYLLRGTEIPRKIALGLAIVFFALAAFKAWQEQYRRAGKAEQALAENSPKLNGEIQWVATGDSQELGQIVFLTAAIYNTGLPSIVRDYSLTLTLLDGRKIVCQPTMLPQTISAGGYTFYAEDALYNKTTTPIAQGGQQPGILLFTLPTGVDLDKIRAKGVRYDLEFKDVLKKSYTATHISTGEPSGRLTYVPGTKSPVSPEKKP